MCHCMHNTQLWCMPPACTSCRYALAPILSAAQLSLQRRLYLDDETQKQTTASCIRFEQQSILGKVQHALAASTEEQTGRVYARQQCASCFAWRIEPSPPCHESVYRGDVIRPFAYDKWRSVIQGAVQPGRKAEGALEVCRSSSSCF